MTDFDDLVKKIPGLDEFIANETAVKDTDAPMSLDDLDHLPDLTTLDESALDALHRRLEGLYSRLEAKEPKSDGKAHDKWEEALDRVSDLLDTILDRLDELDESNF